MNELLKRLKAAEARAKELAEMAELTEEQSKEFEARMAEISEVKALITAKEERMANLQACGIVELEQRLSKPTTKPVETETRNEEIVVGESRAIYSDKQFGVFLQDLVRSAKNVRGGGTVNERLAAQQEILRARRREFRAATGLNESAPSDGGFLVQQDHLDGVMLRAYGTGEILSRVRNQPIGPNANGIKMPQVDEQSRADGYRHGGVRAYWLNEAGTKTASKPKFKQMDMRLEKLAGLVYATDELIEDAVALQSFIEVAMGDELRFKAEDAFINGTGAGQPLGILASDALVSVDKEAGQAAATIVPENLFNMWSRMFAPNRRNAVWYINQDIEPQLFALALAVGTGGSPVYMPAGGISAAPYGTIFGRPVIPIEYAATLGTVGDILFVDPAEYMMIDKGAIKMAVSIHVEFVNDETVIRFVWRLNGQPYWSTTLTPHTGTKTLSPYVALATRA